MKKVFAFVLLGIMLLVMTACSSTFTCDFCGKEVTGKKHTSEILGQKVEYCDSCNSDLNELFN